MQSPRNAELKLLLGLRSSTKLKYLGCRFDRGLVGGVTVAVGNRALGAWWYDRERYAFSSIAYRPGPVTVQTVQEACDETEKLTTGEVLRGAYERQRD